MVSVLRDRSLRVHGVRLIAVSVAPLLAGCPVDDRVLSGEEGTGGRNFSGTGGALSTLDAALDAAGDADGVDAESPDGLAFLDGGPDGATGSGGAGTGGSSSGGSGGATSGCVDGNDNGILDCEESLLANATFDTDDTSPWAAEPLVAQSWSSINVRGVGGSGSLVVENSRVADSEGTTMGGSIQCVAASGDTLYELTSDTFISAGQGEGNAAMSVWMFETPDCSGTPQATQTTALIDRTEIWSRIYGAVRTRPDSRSLLIRLVVVKPFRQQPFRVLFDRVILQER